MARLTLTLAALFAALLFVAHATAYRMITTTTDGGSCREQMQRQQYLNHCERYMRQECMSGSYDEDNQHQQQPFQRCCQQLRRMDEQCRCEGLRQMVRQLQGQLQAHEMREMMQCARDLPKECGIGPDRCAMRGGWF